MSETIVRGKTERFLQEISAGSHRLIADEPIKAGSLTEEQRVKLLEIANKCPVHRNLTSEIKIRTRLAP